MKFTRHFPNPLQASGMHILVSRGGQQWGPYSESQLAGYVASGSFSSNDLCWHEGMSEWQPIAFVIDLPALPPPVPALKQQTLAAVPIFQHQQNVAAAAYASTQTQLRYESEKKSPGLACALNFVLPGLGYIYAGRVIVGLFVLFVWLLCVITFFLGITLLIAGLLWIVGLIDGYLAVERANRRLADRLLGVKS